jgi:hypothetical protein
MSLIENHDKPELTPDERQGFLDLGLAPASAALVASNPAPNPASASAPILPAVAQPRPVAAETPSAAPPGEVLHYPVAETPLAPERDVGAPTAAAELDQVVEPLVESSIEPSVESSIEPSANTLVEPLQESLSMRSHKTANVLQADLTGLPQELAAATSAAIQEATQQATQEPTQETPQEAVPALAPVPAARTPKRRGRIGEAARMAEPDLAEALADVAVALDRRTPPPAEKSPDPREAGRATVPASLSQAAFEQGVSVSSMNAAEAADGGYANQVDSGTSAVLPSFAKTSMPIAVQHRTVKLAAGLLTLTAVFGFVTMVCAIWALYILTHPPLEVPPVGASPVAASAAADQALASSVAALAPAASIPVAAAASASASAPAVVRHHHRHKAKTGTAT